MLDEKEHSDAKLFLNFVKNIREKPQKIDSQALNRILSEAAANSDEKYKCIYCGYEYVYRRSLISHLKRLHNIKTQDD